MRDKYLFQAEAVVPLTHEHYRDEVERLFGVNKTTRKQRANQAEASLIQNLANRAPNASAHPELHRYERDHLEGGGNWPRLKATLLLRFRGVLAINEVATQADFVATVGGIPARIGIAYLGEGRFAPLAVQPFANNPTVYERRGDPHHRHYVLLPTSNTHVKRFVTRGLSYLDAMRLSTAQGLISVVNTQQAQLSEVGGAKHGHGAGTVLTEDEQILSHTRGWGGNKRYISTGVSNRPAFSTRGTQFMSMYGSVVVDLAQVPLASVFDVHRNDVASARIGLPTTDVLNNGHHTGTGDLAEERYLALRDVIRTRELLIKATVPFVSVQKQSLGARLIGIGSVTNGEHNGALNQIRGLAPGIVAHLVSDDKLTFRDPHNANRRWHLFEFSNAASCLVAYNSLVLVGGQIKVRFHKYLPVRPAGMV